METVKVSIIVPCYQCAETIGATIRSVQAQTEQNWELICVDDGSKDGTGALLDQHALGEPRMRVIHQQNGGVSSARNAGIAAAQGEWIAFVDADDWLNEDALSALLALEDGQAEILCGGFTMRYIDENGRTETLTCARGNLQTIYESLIRGDSALNPVYAKLYRRRMMTRESLRFPEGVKIGEDVLFNLHAFAGSHGWAMTDEPLYIYEYGGNSAMIRVKGERFAKSEAMLAGIDRFLEERDLKTALFRAHIDVYIRKLREDYGRAGAAMKLTRRMVAMMTHGVCFLQLCGKQKLYYLALRALPCLSYFLP